MSKIFQKDLRHDNVSRVLSDKKKALGRGDCGMIVIWSVQLTTKKRRIFGINMMSK